jgi:ribonucleoside-diphosphate reductase alpha chain
MRGYDSFAGVIKSGGKTRRAAKIAILDIGHPDIAEFIECKAREERKARALVDAGWANDFDDPEGAYASLQYQNANHSVRVSDAFMSAVEKGSKFSTKAVLTGKVVETHAAKDLWDKMIDAAWECGDPGIQFDDTINRMHTCKESGKINASNPCSEYMFLDDSSCNLATLNLMAFYSDGAFFTDEFQKAVELVILAQDILVDNAFYPLERIAKTTKEFRSLGINYTNLASLLMNDGAPYDSDRGRRLATAITAFMTAVAYRKSALIADAMGTFEGYDQNAFSMKSVIYMHRDSAQNTFMTDEPLGLPILKTWNEVATLGEKHGFRNAQVSLLAPTGTVSFALDADATGIEPFIVLSGGNKKLVGGGDLDVSAGHVVRSSLLSLGYSEDDTDGILTYISEHHTVIGCPAVKEAHYPIFASALSISTDSRAVVSPASHVEMMAAVQPFLSGGISKTVNLPHNISKKEIGDLLLRAWKAGVKSLALYRDGSKASQPLNVSADQEKDKPSKVLLSRKHLPKVRPSIVHAFSVGGCEGYLKLGFYPDTLKIGEVWIHMAKEGSTLRGMFDSFATAVSVALQFGVPIEKFIDKFSHASFEPSGFTGEETVKQASSIIDYIFRWIEANYPDGRATVETFLNMMQGAVPYIPTKPQLVAQKREFDAPICRKCGHIMYRVGSCHTCSVCSESDGCSA